MQKPLFEGHALSFEDQIKLLRSQGLTIDDDQRALQILRNVSYSRLRSYFVILMDDREQNHFRPGATLDQAYAIYGFDRRLRELIFHELEKVEISIRTRIAYATAGYDGGYWFTNPKYFVSNDAHRDLMRKLKSEISRSDNDAIIRFYQRYSNDFPPCWQTLEATSMGTLSGIYNALRPGSMRRNIASYYGVSDTVFTSWLHHLVYIRNTCAHHGRLWNKTLSVRAIVPQSPHRYFPPQSQNASDHIYLTLCIVKYLQNIVKPTNTFADRLRSLIEHYPIIDIRRMGFPADWTSDPFWATRAEEGQQD